MSKARAIDKSKIKRILICRTDRLGDLILTLPLINYAKKVFGGADLDIYCSKGFDEILKGYKDLNNVFNTSDKSISSLLKENHYDLIIDCLPRPANAWAAFTNRVPFRIGTAYRAYSFLYNHKVYEHRKESVKHESVYNLNLLHTFFPNDIPVIQFHFDINFSEQQEYLSALSKAHRLKQSYIILHPFTGGSAAEWNTDCFIDTIYYLRDKFPDYSIVITGNEYEKEKSAVFNRSAVINLTGYTTLHELMYIINGSLLFISASTGPIHLAGALNKNIIGLYPSEKPMNPERWKPLSSHTEIITGNITNGQLEIPKTAVFDKILKLLSIETSLI